MVATERRSAPKGIPQEVHQLKPFPAVVHKLITMLDDPRISLRQFSDVISSDAAITSDMLRLSNSAMFSIRVRVTTVLQALAVLGMQRVHDLVVVTAMSNYASAGGSGPQHEALRRCWRHNLATAITASDLAGACGLRRPPAYLAGLLLEIGRLALLRAFPHRYLALMESSECDDAAFLTREIEQFGIDHLELGAQLADKWNFPPSVVHAIRGRPSDVQRVEVGDLVRAASSIAGMLGFPSIGEEKAWDPEVVAVLLQPVGLEALSGLHESTWLDTTVQIRAFEASLAT